MGLKDRTLDEFLAAVAAPTPTPGGGSVSALAGACAVALARMVAGLARGKKGFEARDADLVRIEEKARRLQAELEDLITEDASAYEVVIAAMRMPRDTAAQKAARVDAMQSAYRGATEVPLRIVEHSFEALQLAEAALEAGNRSATTDAAVAILLAEAAIRGASLNCRVNLASIRDESFRTTAEERLADFLRRADSVGHTAMAIVEGRL